MRRRSGNVLIPAFDIRFATGDGDDVPVVQSKKVAQKISTHDSRRAGNQRLLAVRHERAPYVLVSSKVILEVCLNGIGARLLPKSIPRSILHSQRRPVIAALVFIDQRSAMALASTACRSLRSSQTQIATEAG